MQYYLFGKDCVGPLKGDHMIDVSPLATTNGAINIMFLGDTYAGKSRMIASTIMLLAVFLKKNNVMLVEELEKIAA